MEAERKERAQLPEAAEREIRAVGNAAVLKYCLSGSPVEQQELVRQTAEAAHRARLLRAQSDYQALQNAKTQLRAHGSRE